MQFKIILTALLAALPVVLSTSNGSQSCSGNQFWHNTQKSGGCCLDKGGPREPPSPPKGNSCKGDEYWHGGKGCCVPRCPSGWNYDSKTRDCKCPTPPTPENPHPSNKSNNNPGKGYKRRDVPKSRVETCPWGRYACSVAGVPGDFTCIDIKTDLENCGGCTAEGQGQDCSTIENVDNYACENKKCRVYTCQSGYKPTVDGGACVAL